MRITNIYYVYYGSGTKFIHLILTTILWSKIYYLLSPILDEETKAKSIDYFAPNCVSSKSQSWDLNVIPLFDSLSVFCTGFCRIPWSTLFPLHLPACLPVLDKNIHENSSHFKLSFVSPELRVQRHSNSILINLCSRNSTHCSIPPCYAILCVGKPSGVSPSGAPKDDTDKF